MKIICHKNSGSELPNNYYDEGYTSQSIFDLRLGNTYLVYAMCMWKGGIIQYLLVGEGSYWPRWYPAVLFEVTDSSLPKCWYYAFRGNNPEYYVTAVWGYYELVNMETHFDELVEMDGIALDIFLSRKSEIEILSEPHK